MFDFLGLKREDEDMLADCVSETADGDLVISKRKINEAMKAMKEQNRVLFTDARNSDNAAMGGFIVAILVVVVLASYLIPIMANQSQEIQDSEDVDQNTKDISGNWTFFAALAVFIYIIRKAIM